MDFTLTPDQEAIRENVERLCARFDDDYWLDRDDTGEFPADFHQAMAAAGWLGIAMPEEFGGAALGVTEAAILMHTVARSSGAMSAASAIHINIFGPHPIVVFGTAEQKGCWLPDLIQGKAISCFGVTEPDAGLNTTRIKTKAERSGNGFVVNGKSMRCAPGCSGARRPTWASRATS
jgi:acyl-CoA dehydrogenase